MSDRHVAVSLMSEEELEVLEDEHGQRAASTSALSRGRCNWCMIQKFIAGFAILGSFILVMAVLAFAPADSSISPPGGMAPAANGTIS